MVPTPQQASAGYHTLWSRAEIRPEKKSAATAIALKIAAHRDVYEAIEKKTGVPWFMVGAIHNRESSLSFRAHLHNGDSLGARTYHVPAGRPKSGSPPFTFEESAGDALTMPPHRLNRVEEWSVERILYECEKYNGWGYLNRRPSPYLWSWTSIYRGGKYVADGVYDPDAWDQQAGCAAVFKALAGMEPGVAARLAHREAAPPRDVAAETTEQARTMRNAGSALAGTGAVAHGTAQLGTGTQPPDKSALISPLATYGVIGAGLALVIVAAVLIAHRRKLLLAKWS